KHFLAGFEREFVRWELLFLFPLLAHVLIHRIGTVDEILVFHLGEFVGEVFLERLGVGGRVDLVGRGEGGRRDAGERAARERGDGGKEDRSHAHRQPIFAVVLSFAPLLSVQLILRSLPLAPPLKLNFTYGSFETAGPQLARNTVLPLCSKVSCWMKCGGMICPCASFMKPESIGCWISACTSVVSPFTVARTRMVDAIGFSLYLFLRMIWSKNRFPLFRIM